MTQRHIETIKKMNNPKAFWAKPIIAPSSPLTKTLHPKNRFEEEDRKIKEEILAAAAADEPVDISELVKSGTDRAEQVNITALSTVTYLYEGFTLGLLNPLL